MIAWEELPERVHETMKFLGEFGPTVHHKDKLIKGHMWSDGECHKVYLKSDDLRKLGIDMCRVANWLEMRAALDRGEEDRAPESQETALEEKQPQPHESAKEEITR